MELMLSQAITMDPVVTLWTVQMAMVRTMIPMSPPVSQRVEVSFFDGTWGDVHCIGSVGCGRTFNNQCSCAKEIFVRGITHSHGCAINDGLGKGGTIVRDEDMGDGPFQVGRQVVKQLSHFSEGWGQGRRRGWVVAVGQEFGVRVRGGDPSFGSDDVFRG